MKSISYLMTLVVIAMLIFGSSALAQQVSPPKELEAVRAEYFRRQDAAIQPVKVWYRQQVEQLEKAAIQRNDLEAALALRKEKESLNVAPPVGTQTLTIVKATYGIDKRTVDVTRQLQMAVSNNKFHLSAPWGFSPDPAFGVRKEIKIQYRYGVAEKTATFNQEQDITLPRSSDLETGLSR